MEYFRTSKTLIASSVITMCFDCFVGRNVRILAPYSWPSAAQLELDNSQLEAVKMALTKEFAVIQGPPGTGKTYIGLKVQRC